jgi:hypothetical protein
MRHVREVLRSERKVAAAGDRAENRFRDARSQAGRYARGWLAGNELTAAPEHQLAHDQE